MSCDTVVIGAGVIGAAVARELARDGHSVIVIERHAVASGTSARGEGNILVSDKGPGAELDLALDARRRWSGVEVALRDELGDDLPPIEFESKGGLVVATDEEAAGELRAFARAQASSGVRMELMSASEARAIEPHVTPRIALAVWYPDDAQVQPVAVTEALLESARRSGATVMTATDVTGAIVDSSGRLLGVRTTKGEFRAGSVVNAAGPWSGDVSRALGAPIPVHPRRGTVLVTTRMPRRIHHKVYDGDYVGAVTSGSGALQTSSVVESTAAGTVLIGSSRERVGFRDEFRAATVGELAAKSIELFPFLAAASAMRTYSGFRPYMPDHVPVIGADGRMPGLWHATGHEGAGIGLSVATAALLADLMAGRATTVDAEAFGLGRPSLAAHLEGAA